MIKFFVPGQPVGKGRPRTSTKNGVFRVHTDKRTTTKEKEVKAIAWSAMHENGRLAPTDKPCAVFVDAAYRVGTSFTKKRKALCYGQKERPGKPDIDNVVKLVMDAMNGVVYRDDTQAVVTVSLKRYAVEGEEQGVMVTVIPLENAAGLREIVENMIERLEERKNVEGDS